MNNSRNLLKGLFGNSKYAIKMSIRVTFLKLLLHQFGYKIQFYACNSRMLPQKFMKSHDFTSIYLWRNKSNDITVIRVILQKKSFTSQYKSLHPNLNISQIILNE